MKYLNWFKNIFTENIVDSVSSTWTSFRSDVILCVRFFTCPHTYAYFNSVSLYINRNRIIISAEHWTQCNGTADGTGEKKTTTESNNVKGRIPYVHRTYPGGSKIQRYFSNVFVIIFRTSFQLVKSIWRFSRVVFSALLFIHIAFFLGPSF